MNTKKLVQIALIKGAVHATIIPTIIGLFANVVFKGNVGFSVALFYVGFVAAIYITSNNKDIAKMSFFVALKIYIVLIGSYLSFTTFGGIGLAFAVAIVSFLFRDVLFEK